MDITGLDIVSRIMQLKLRIRKQGHRHSLPWLLENLHKRFPSSLWWADILALCGTPGCLAYTKCSNLWYPCV